MKVGLYKDTIAIDTCKTISDEYYEVSLMEAVAYTMSITHPTDRQKTLEDLAHALSEASEIVYNML